MMGSWRWLIYSLIFSWPGLSAPTSGFAFVLGICIRHATGVNTPYRRPTTAIIRVRRGRAVADAGFGQHEFDSLCGFAVASDIGDDRTDLFVPGDHQEGGRASVGFHAGEIEA